jgi:ABC-type cobalamin transport system permease subunit
VGLAGSIPLISMFFKLGLASLITGAVLQALDLNALALLEKVGVTPQAAVELVHRGVFWALPNIVLGSMIIVPAWTVIYLLRPPGERK